MGMNNIIFLENIEWFDDSGQELVHRIPQKGSGEIKFGAQLTVIPMGGWQRRPLRKPDAYPEKGGIYC